MDFQRKHTCNAVSWLTTRPWMLGRLAPALCTCEAVSHVHRSTAPAAVVAVTCVWPDMRHCRKDMPGWQTLSIPEIPRSMWMTDVGATGAIETCRPTAFTETPETPC